MSIKGKLVVLVSSGTFLLCVACGSGSSKSSSDSTPAANNSSAVLKGSGKACPQLNGRYDCNLTDEEKAEGIEGNSLEFKSGRNEAGIPTLDATGTVYLVDGELHKLTGEGGMEMTYSVDCSEKVLSLHGSGSHHLDLSMKLTVDGKSVISETRASGDGHPATIEVRLCTQK